MNNMAKERTVYFEFEKLAIDETQDPWEQATPPVVEAALNLGPGYEIYVAAYLSDLAEGLEAFAGALPLDLRPSHAGKAEQVRELTSNLDDNLEQFMDGLIMPSAELIRSYLAAARGVVQQVSERLNPIRPQGGWILKYEKPAKRGRPPLGTPSPTVGRRNAQEEFARQLRILSDALGLLAGIRKVDPAAMRGLSKSIGVSRARFSAVAGLLTPGLVPNKAIVTRIQTYLRTVAPQLREVAQFLERATTNQGRIMFCRKAKGRPPVVKAAELKRTAKAFAKDVKNWGSNEAAIMNYRVEREAAEKELMKTGNGKGKGNIVGRSRSSIYRKKKQSTLPHNRYIK